MRRTEYNLQFKKTMHMDSKFTMWFHRSNPFIGQIISTVYQYMRKYKLNCLNVRLIFYNNCKISGLLNISCLIIKDNLEYCKKTVLMNNFNNTTL